MELENFRAETREAFAHLGLCSSDIVETARDLQIRDSLNYIKPKIRKMMFGWADFVDRYKGLMINGRTHLLQGSATTIGYRFATPLGGMINAALCLTENSYAARGLRGAVGTGSALRKLGIFEEVNEEYQPILMATGQVPTRVGILRIANDMSTMAMMMNKACADLRLMTSWGEMDWKSDGRASSSLIHKKVNPTHAERVCSLARTIPHLAHQIWEAGAHSYCERTLDDSAVLRIVIPQLFETFNKMLDDMVVVLERASPREALVLTREGTSEISTVAQALWGAKDLFEAQERAKNNPLPIDDPDTLGDAVERCEHVINEIIFYF